MVHLVKVMFWLASLFKTYESFTPWPINSSRRKMDLIYLAKNLAWTRRSALEREVCSCFSRRRWRGLGSLFMAIPMGCMTMNYDSWVVAVASRNVRCSRSKNNPWMCL